MLASVCVRTVVAVERLIKFNGTENTLCVKYWNGVYVVAVVCNVSAERERRMCGIRRGR